MNGSFYLYDYENIHTVATEVNQFFGTSTSVLPAPGAEIKGLEAELTWLATDQLTIGGSLSYTPNEYTEDLFILDPAGYDRPESLFGATTALKNIKGNQLLQVPESKFNGWATYVVPLDSGANLTFSTSYSWIDKVYYSPFQNEDEMAEDYGRLDMRATWTSGDGRMMLTGFVNNFFDDVGVLQVLRHGEEGAVQAVCWNNASTAYWPRVHSSDESANVALELEFKKAALGPLFFWSLKIQIDLLVHTAFTSCHHDGTMKSQNRTLDRQRVPGYTGFFMVTGWIALTLSGCDPATWNR